MVNKNFQPDKTPTKLDKVRTAKAEIRKMLDDSDADFYSIGIGVDDGGTLYVKVYLNDDPTPQLPTYWDGVPIVIVPLVENIKPL